MTLQEIDASLKKIEDILKRIDIGPEARQYWEFRREYLENEKLQLTKEQK